jgi:hypothetical protein
MHPLARNIRFKKGESYVGETGKSMKVGEEGK